MKTIFYTPGTHKWRKVLYWIVMVLMLIPAILWSIVYVSARSIVNLNEWLNWHIDSFAEWALYDK